MRHILVIDDDHAVREFTGSAVRALGHRATTFDSSAGAMEFLQTGSDDVHLVLLDMILGEENGEDVFRMIQGRRPDLPIVLISGYCNADRVRQLLKDGAREFVTKPFGLNELSRLIGSHA